MYTTLVFDHLFRTNYFTDLPKELHELIKAYTERVPGHIEISCDELISMKRYTYKNLCLLELPQFTYSIILAKYNGFLGVLLVFDTVTKSQYVTARMRCDVNAYDGTREFFISNQYNNRKMYHLDQIYEPALVEGMMINLCITVE